MTDSKPYKSLNMSAANQITLLERTHEKNLIAIKALFAKADSMVCEGKGYAAPNYLKPLGDLSRLDKAMKDMSDTELTAIKFVNNHILQIIRNNQE